MNEKEPAYPETLVSAFDRICDENPDKTAVLDSDRSITYAQLRKESCAMANCFRDLIGTGEVQLPVCLMAGKTLSHICCALAVMRAGHIYVPVDAAYPAERVSFILRSTHAYPHSRSGLHHSTGRRNPLQPDAERGGKDSCFPRRGCRKGGTANH